MECSSEWGEEYLGDDVGHARQPVERDPLEQVLLEGQRGRAQAESRDPRTHFQPASHLRQEITMVMVMVMAIINRCGNGGGSGGDGGGDRNRCRGGGRRGGSRDGDDSC